VKQVQRIGAIVVAAIVAVVAFQAGTHRGERTAVSTGADPAAERADDPAPARAPSPSTATPAAAGSLPADSVAALLSLPDFTGTYAAYALAARAADERAVLALIDDAKQVERRNDRLALIAIFISRFGELDPERALAYIASSDLEMKPSLVFRVVSAWSKVDLAAAMAAVSRLSPADLKRAGSDGILAAHADDAPAALADIRARLSAPAVAAGPSPPAVLAMAGTDPASALTEAAKLGGQERMVTSFGIGNIWAQRDPEAAYAYSRTISDPAIQEAFRRGLFGAWMESDPTRVLRLLDGNANEGERNAILNDGVVRLTQRDPRRAFAVARSVDDPRARNAVLQRVFRTWALQDPFAASAALDEVDAADMANLAELVGREFAQRAPAEAVRWVSGFGDEFSPAHRIVVTEIAKRDAQLALDSVGAFRPEQQRLAVSWILSTLAESDPVAAAGYWQQLPADTRAGSAAQIAGNWQRQDPGAAANWLLGLPSGADRDLALGRFVAAAATDYRDVPRLLNAVAAPETRAELAWRRIRRLVNEQQIAQAEAELARMDLPADARREAQVIIDSAGR
jgi:hypothetical protein